MKTISLLTVAMSLVAQGIEPVPLQDEILVGWLGPPNQLLIFEPTA